MKIFSLEKYLSNGVENIVKGALKASLSNPKESIFMAKYALASKKSRTLREEAEKEGLHIPPFLIASITTKCNLHCAGCYARGNDACADDDKRELLATKEWKRIFEEAKELGTGFILLAGGEPMMRWDVIEEAAKVPDILFPIFTNGTMFREEYFALLSRHRNLVPVLSIEGNEENTNHRRGEGVYTKLVEAMNQLKKHGILFGTSVTITTENLEDAMGQKFISNLYQKGCKVVFFIEYVPIDAKTQILAPSDEERNQMKENIGKLRETYEDMVFISFPGDEKTSGGCLAAGRGFFHINAVGGAEPCPFSPYSDTSLVGVPLKKALASHLFHQLIEQDLLMEEHDGGCVLFEKREQLEALLRNN